MKEKTQREIVLERANAVSEAVRAQALQDKTPLEKGDDDELPQNDNEHTYEPITNDTVADDDLPTIQADEESEEEEETE